MTFIKSYWFELVIVALSVASFIITWIRSGKFRSVDAVKNMIAEYAPGFINLAEASGVSGQAKLMFVIDSLMKRIRQYVSSKDEQYWMSYIREQVECILSTPQKKG